MTSEMPSQRTTGLDLVWLFGWRLERPMFDPLRQAIAAILGTTRGSRCGVAPGGGGTDKGREKGWPDCGFVAAWLWSIPAFRRSVWLPADVGID